MQVQQRNKVVASIQSRQYSLFREILTQKNKHLNIPTSEFSAIAWQKGSLLNHTIIKNIQEYHISLY